MPNLEWDVAHALKSPLGTLDLNVVDGSTGRWYLIHPDGYKIVPTMRVTDDHISQQSGSVVHKRYTSGLVATMTVEYAIAPSLAGPDYVPACGADLREMHEALMLHIEALLDVSADPNTNQQLIWTPTGLGDNRMLTEIQTLGWADPAWLDPGTSVTFSFECPRPYAIDATPIDTAVAGPVLIPNSGNTPYYPVWQVHGATSSFTITNTDTGEKIVYLGDTIPGGSYVEIITFLGTAFLNGSSTDLINGITPSQTDFFPIAPGGTHVTIAGATAHAFTNNSYC